MTDEHDGDINDAAKPTADALAALFGEAAPGTVFSEPIHVGDDLVITAVAWERAGGFGFGRGRRLPPTSPTPGVDLGAAVVELRRAGQLRSFGSRRPEWRSSRSSTSRRSA